MKRKAFLLLVVVAVMLVGTVGVALAMSSVSYQIASNSLQGGGAGGGVVSSTNYAMTVTFGGTVQVDNASTNYAQCNGFLCQAKNFLWRIFLPLLMKG